MPLPVAHWATARPFLADRPAEPRLTSLALLGNQEAELGARPWGLGLQWSGWGKTSLHHSESSNMACWNLLSKFDDSARDLYLYIIYILCRIFQLAMFDYHWITGQLYIYLYIYIQVFYVIPWHSHIYPCFQPDLPSTAIVTHLSGRSAGRIVREYGMIQTTKVNLANEWVHSISINHIVLRCNEKNSDNSEQSWW